MPGTKVDKHSDAFGIALSSLIEPFLDPAQQEGVGTVVSHSSEMTSRLGVIAPTRRRLSLHSLL